jgi:hypothetical protein
MSNMFPNLADATVQEIQLELMRRASFNEFDGPKVAESLERHREKWIAAWMTRFGVHREEHPDWYPAMSLIPLRDLRGNRWNVDTLIVLTEDVERARQLAAVAEAEDWRADDVHVEEHEDEISMALGVFPCRKWILSVWWD